MTLDGVMQSPGGPKEDPSGGFEYGGWLAPYFDDAGDKEMAKQMQPADLLLGRKTFTIFESWWPEHTEGWPGVNQVKKYVLSNTRNESTWDNTVFLKDLDAIKQLKKTEGRDLQVHGSSMLAQLLLKHNLVDELWLKFFPVTLGKGKKLFGEGTIPTAFELVNSFSTPSGIIFANYKRTGEVKTGTVEG